MRAGIVSASPTPREMMCVTQVGVRATLAIGPKRDPGSGLSAGFPRFVPRGRCYQMYQRGTCLGGTVYVLCEELVSSLGDYHDRLGPAT